MSTCRGAAAPHENCPHSLACDWDATEAKALADFTVALRAEAAEAALDGSRPLNRADRRAAAKASRRAK